MKSIVESKGLSEKFEITSCATSSEELGNPIYPPAGRTLDEHNIPYTDRCARRMTAEDYANNDYIIAMDKNNLRNMKDRIGNDPRGKVKLMMSYLNKDCDVPDPWYTGDFEGVYRSINVACMEFLNVLIK